MGRRSGRDAEGRQGGRGLSTLVDTEYGGWFQSAAPESGEVRDIKGNEWKLDYHQTTMALELIRLIEDSTLTQ